MDDEVEEAGERGGECTATREVRLGGQCGDGGRCVELGRSIERTGDEA